VALPDATFSLRIFPPASSLALFLSLIAPSRCAGCGRPRRGAGGGGFCRSCWEGLPRFEAGSTCPRCALPTGGMLCRGCASSEPPVARTVAFGPYEGGLKRLVHVMKFQGFDIAAAPAGARLADAVRRSGIDASDAVVAVPSTRDRNRERGYDPGALLAQELGRRLSLRILPALTRVRETPPQSALGASERRSNVAGAFRGRPIAAGRSLLLVDDVMTTGATVFTAARALRDAGARCVDLAILARTPEPDA
jgi:ComF family protein